MMNNVARAQTVRELRRRLQQIERGRPALPRAEDVVPTCIGQFDALLPEGGFRRGTLAEWLTREEGSGAASIALQVVSRLMLVGGHFVVVDRKKEFHPCAAAASGVDLDRTLLIQPSTERDVLWALEQALRCPGVAATLGWVSETRERVFRRLQLAAESGGGLGMLLRPQSASREPCWADLRFSVEPVPSHESRPGRHVLVSLLYCRAGMAEGECELCIHDETSDFVRVVSPLAAPKAASSKARA